ncbi:amidohydrolase [Marinobacterium sp. YM272]|uniref:amidohydrolase n=1 Tax=Marinobacterium sp. YM272 TaxID=3421654 RepID=UPI003D7F4AC7
MDKQMRVTLVQSALEWEAPDVNRRHFSSRFDALAGNTDLIILPEMFTSGFSMAPERVAETPEGPTLAWMRAEAKRTGAAICGSLAVSTESGFVNRFLWVEPDGQQQFYDKRHLFRMGEEPEHYVAGNQRPIIEYRGWRVLPIVCYDLRFPVWCRNRNDYDLMICVANWPAPRRHVWRTLLMARAMENQCYVAGVNRIGRDGLGLDYAGDSLLLDFKGESLNQRDDGDAWLETRLLDAGALCSFRERFPAWKDADEFQLADSSSRRT